MKEKETKTMNKPPSRVEEPDEYGKHYGKLDLDRVGFFDDTPPGPHDEFSERPLDGGLRGNLSKKRRLISGEPGDFFEKEFKRIFKGEVIPDPKVRKTAKKGEEEAKKLPIIPPGTAKHHSTPGDWYGCIGKQPKRFDPETISLPAREEPPHNFKTKPNPVGGPGYVNICINPYVPVYLGYEPYDPEDEPTDKATDGKPRLFVNTCAPRKYFDENPYKTPGYPIAPMMEEESKPAVKRSFFTTFPRAPYGPHSGCFGKFPRHWDEPYEVETKKRTKKRKGEPWNPAGIPQIRTKFTTSIIDKVTKVACNANNFTSYREQVYPI